MKWSSLLLALLTLPLLFNSVPLEVLRLKTFDALVPEQNPTGHFTILNITEQDLDEMGGYPLPRQDLATDSQQNFRSWCIWRRLGYVISTRR
jgi:CHASE2 domain-containing sensor protein